MCNLARILFVEDNSNDEKITLVFKTCHLTNEAVANHSLSSSPSRSI
jgi:hypothetical protein